MVVTLKPHKHWAPASRSLSMSPLTEKPRILYSFKVIYPMRVFCIAPVFAGHFAQPRANGLGVFHPCVTCSLRRAYTRVVYWGWMMQYIKYTPSARHLVSQCGGDGCQTPKPTSRPRRQDGRRKRHIAYGHCADCGDKTKVFFFCGREVVSIKGAQTFIWLEKFHRN